MSGIGTKGVGEQKVSTGGKFINPGNVKARLLGVTITTSINAKMKNREEIVVKLNLESEPVGGDFVGFPINKDDKEGPKYLGRIGTVKSKDFPYSDFEYQGELKPGVDQAIGFLRRVAQELTGDQSWFDKDVNYPSWAELADSFNKEVLAPVKDVYVDWCIAAEKGEREHEGKKYPQYWLYLAKNDQGFTTICGPHSKNPLQPFDPALHIKLPKGESRPEGGFSEGNIPQANPGIGAGLSGNPLLDDDDDLPFDLEDGSGPLFEA